jgi:cytochrome c biogenesis protein CcmG, thiol:disulfide interchange protein DsbE
MMEDAARATEPSEAGASAPHGTRALLAVLGLAVGFALVPRVTRGCEGATQGADAPEWNARIVANSEALGADAASSGKVALSSLRGRPVVLDFWATWCGPCQAESPIVNAVAERYRGRGLAVIGVNTSDEDGLAAHYIKKKGFGFPIVFDDGNAIAKKYGVSTLPTLIVVSKTGKIAAVRHGVTSDSDLDEIVRRQL